MRVIIFGSRTLTSPAILEAAIRQLETDRGRKVTALVEGGQVTYISGRPGGGADWLAAQWARSRGLPVTTYRADWSAHGKRAGPLRNQRMVDEAGADAALAVWDGSSRGTEDMIARCLKAGIPLTVYHFRKEDQ